MAKGKAKGRTKAQLNYAVPARQQRSSVAGTTSSSKAVEKVCAITDPFCPHARGSKLPDSDSSKSVPVTLRFTYQPSTDANGRFVRAVGPSLLAMFVDATNAAALTTTQVTTWAGVADSVSDYAAIAAAFDKYRIVSWGFRVYTTLAPTNQSGTIRIITTPVSASGVAPYVYSGGLHEAVDVHPVANCDLHWVSKPIGVEFREYRLINAAHSWDNAVVVGNGLPASSAGAIVIETFMHLECQIELGQITATLATKAADHNPSLMRASAHAHSSRPSLMNAATHQVSSMLKGFAQRGLASLARVAVPYVGGALGRLIEGGGGPRRRVPMIAPYVEEVD